MFILLCQILQNIVSHAKDTGSASQLLSTKEVLIFLYDDTLRGPFVLEHPFTKIVLEY